MTAPLLDRVASACRAVGAADPGVVAFYLFGSHAAGDARPDSDEDLGVLFSGEAGSILTQRSGDIEAVLGGLTGWLRDHPEKVDRSL